MEDSLQQKQIAIHLFSKQDLQLLIEGVKRGDREATSRAIDFLTVESFGLWHNRARAKLCRYFKNHPPARVEQERIVDAVVGRLLDGRFSEQFKDQLAMAIRLSPDRLHETAMRALGSNKDYIRRYGGWVRKAFSRPTDLKSNHDSNLE